MRDPYNLNKMIYPDDSQDTQVIKIDNMPEFDVEDYNLLDDKEFNKYMKSVENICRSSFEYQQLIRYLRENMNMNKCSFFTGVSNVDSYKIKIHIHHEPFTLYDVCKTVVNKRQQCGESLDENLVAQEAMYLHYSLMVGLIPLCETVHELVHANYIFIPIDKVFGNIYFFEKEYGKYFDDDLRLNWDKVKEFTKAYKESIDQNRRLLEKKYIYVDPSGMYSLPKYEDVVGLLDNKLESIRGNLPESKRHLGDVIDGKKVIMERHEIDSNILNKNKYLDYNN